MVCSCGHGNETSGSITGGEFLDQQSNYWLIKDSLISRKFNSRKEGKQC